MDFIQLKDGTKLPILGQGTWFMGEKKQKKEEEIKALQTGIEEKMTLIDTAEMYGDGLAELLVGESIKPFKREDLFLVSKVYPHNAGKEHIFDACNRTLQRMQTDYLDMYLLHWRGRVPFAETVDCMEELIKQGKIRRWGVSNLDTMDMEELFRVKNGENCMVNQVLYHLGSRGIEYNLLPFMQKEQIALMAYCPLAQGGTLRHNILNAKSVNEIAINRGITQMQVLLAFVLNQKSTIAIPKASSCIHTKENVDAASIKLTENEIKALNLEFQKPKEKTYLDIV